MTKHLQLVSLALLLLFAALRPSYGDPLTVTAPIFSSGDVAINGDPLTIAALVSAGGSLALPGAPLTIVLDAGGADAGAGSTATLAGQLSGQHVTIAGGADIDTIVFLGPTVLVTFTAAQSGTISAPGMTDIIFGGIENFTGNVTFAAAGQAHQDRRNCTIGRACLQPGRRPKHQEWPTHAELGRLQSQPQRAAA